jgi:hypothetical protein
MRTHAEDGRHSRFVAGLSATASWCHHARAYRYHPNNSINAGKATSYTRFGERPDVFGLEILSRSFTCDHLSTRILDIRHVAFGRMRLDDARREPAARTPDDSG